MSHHMVSENSAQTGLVGGKAPLVDLLATGFYAGRSPKAPGTCGTAVAVILAYLLTRMDFEIFLGGKGLVVVAVVSVLAIVVSNRALSSRIYATDSGDPQQIVIDEIAGYFVTLVLHPWSWKIAIAAFVLFRIFDVTKIFPVNRAEKFPRGYGIVADDLVAGVYANLVLTVLLFFGIL